MANTQTLQFVTLRHYLRTARPTVAEDIMVAAFDRDEPGALQLVEMAGQLRGNKRTRRTVEVVRQERRKRRRGAGTPCWPRACWRCSAPCAG